MHGVFVQSMVVKCEIAVTPFGPIKQKDSLPSLLRHKEASMFFRLSEKEEHVCHKNNQNKIRAPTESFR